MMNRTAALMVALVLVAHHVDAQTPEGGHVLKLDEGAQPAQATLEDIAWLAGAWRGEAFGGTFEEVWTRPTAGSMVGLFKLMHGTETSMYEIETMTEEEGSLVWKVKHFNADFSAWEEKTEFVAFPLVKIEENAAYFDGLTLIRDGENIRGYLSLSADGTTREEELFFRPVGLRDSKMSMPKD